MKYDDHYYFRPTNTPGTVIIKLIDCLGRKRWVKRKFYDKREGFILSILKIILEFFWYFSIEQIMKCLYRRAHGIRAGNHEIDVSWITEIYVIVCIVLASLAFYLFPGAHARYSQIYNIIICLFNCFLFHTWIYYRLFTFSVFILEWVFIVRGNIKSPSRSILLFIFNLIEVSIIFTVIQAMLAQKMAINVDDVFCTLHSMMTFEEPNSSLERLPFYVDVLRLILGAALMLVVVAGAVGQLVRTSADK